MSNELIPASDAPSTEVANLDAAASSAAYLGYVALLTSNSEKCKTGEFPINHFAFVKDKEYHDLGSSVDVVVLSGRAKAIRYGEVIQVSHDMESELYKDIVRASAAPGLNGNQHGPEFLLWIPEIEQYATFHFGSKSSRREARPMTALLRSAATLSPKKCQMTKDGKELVWFVPKVDACSSITQFTPPEDMLEKIETFLNPPKIEQPEVDEDAGDRER